MKIAITTTPRADNSANIKQWLVWLKEHFTSIPASCEISKIIAAMPARPSAVTRAELDELLPGGREYCASMEPGAIGAGDTFRGACFAAFADNSDVDYALHVP